MTALREERNTEYFEKSRFFSHNITALRKERNTEYFEKSKFFSQNITEH